MANVFTSPTAGQVLVWDAAGVSHWITPITSINLSIPGMASAGAITNSGTITMGGQLAIANGGTGNTTGVATGLSAPLSFANGGQTGTSAFPATSGTVSIPMTSSVITVTPSGAIIANATGGVVGQIATIVFLTSGTTSFTTTFGTNFRSTGTLSTGTTTAKILTVTFLCTSATPTWVEIARTAAQ